MPIQIDELIGEAQKLSPVPLAATAAYHKKSPILTNFVNETLAADPSIHELIGNNPLQFMYDNHRHHAAFMATVFSIGNYELLARTVPWVYRAYAGHNFSYHYFTLALKTWMRALDQFMDPTHTAEIKSIYAWMLSRHEQMIYLSQIEADSSATVNLDWLEAKNSFQAAILAGDHRKCLEIANQSVTSGKALELFYLQIIQPVMYEIGMLWERGTISVAQEHLASAIVTRIMATTSMIEIDSRHNLGRAVVTAAPNEFHEIGAWMISDVLEHEGWDVRYLGANTPVNDIIELLRDFGPQVLALSVTMPFNLLKAKDMITAVKTAQDLKPIKIMVGGRPFIETAGLWRSMGADGFAANAGEARRLAAGWQLNEEI